MTDSAMNDVTSTLAARDHTGDYISLNAELNFWATNEKGEKIVQYDKDREAVRQYFLNYVNPNTQWFHDLEEKIDFLVENEYYEKEFLDKYSFEFVKTLYKKVYAHKYRFPTLVSAVKFYNGYALKNFSGNRILERLEDRVSACALYLANGNKKYALELAEEMISGRLQLATPTFLNSGKKSRGELVSCFLLNVSDDLNSIMRSVNSAAQLSKRGGGVALCLTSVRAKGDPIKKIENQASGVIPVMKILEDTFSYANQLGARQGAGAVYLNAHHIDIMDFLDTKRENADEKIRIKTLSLGVVIPDITFELAKKNEPMYLFSPYDIQKVYGKEFAWINVSEIYREAVDNPLIRKKKINARDFLSTLAEVQMESGYPYILFEDAANRAMNVTGKIIMSNLCSEILQPQTDSILNNDQTYAETGKDISCNLGSMNIVKHMESPDFGKSIEVAVRALATVSDMSDIDAVPTVREGNRKSHSIGLGQMNLHSMFGINQMFYGDEESLDFTNMYFYTTLYHVMRTNNLIAKEKGETFEGYETSKYASGEFFERYTDGKIEFKPLTKKVERIFAERNIHIPTVEDWEALQKSVKKHGLYCRETMATAPTGSISFLTHSTSSILPTDAPGGLVMSRTEGKLGTLFVSTPGSENNENFFRGQDAVTVGAKKIIDVYSIAQAYVDQSLSLTVTYKGSATTKTITSGYLYAFSKGRPNNKPADLMDERELMLRKFEPFSANIKTLYYVRVNNDNLAALASQECVSCAL